MTIPTDAPELAERVRYSEMTRIVLEDSPALIEALEKASEENHQREDAWQDEVDRHQRAAVMPEQSLESPFGKALKDASRAVVARFEELRAAKQEEDRSS